MNTLNTYWVVVPFCSLPLDGANDGDRSINLFFNACYQLILKVNGSTYSHMEQTDQRASTRAHLKVRQGEA